MEKMLYTIKPSVRIKKNPSYCTPKEIQHNLTWRETISYPRKLISAPTPHPSKSNSPSLLRTYHNKDFFIWYSYVLNGIECQGGSNKFRHAQSPSLHSTHLPHPNIK